MKLLEAFAHRNKRCHKNPGTRDRSMNAAPIKRVGSGSRLPDPACAATNKFSPSPLLRASLDKSSQRPRRGTGGPWTPPPIYQPVRFPPSARRQRQARHRRCCCPHAKGGVIYMHAWPLLYGAAQRQTWRSGGEDSPGRPPPVSPLHNDARPRPPRPPVLA